MAKSATRDASLDILSRVGRDEGKGETCLSSLIESGRHGFEIWGGTNSSEQARTSGDWTLRQLLAEKQ
jgi:hypothetical protein